MNKTNLFLIPALAISSLCYASRDMDEIATELPFGGMPHISEEPEPIAEFTPSYGDNDVLVKSLKGVYLYQGDTPPPVGAKAGVKGVEFSGNFVSLSAVDQRVLQSQISRAILYQPLTRKKLQEVRAIIANYYKSKHRPFVLVIIPEQDITDQVLAISVIESRLGAVTVTGNRYFSSDQYLKEISLQEGSEINSDTLMGDLTWINRNPFRTTNAVFKPGEELYTTDVEIVAEDYNPFQVYLGTDNTGMNISDYGRLFAGFNWGNAFNTGQIISYQFTSSPDFHKFWSQTLSYTAPLPWRDTIMIFGGYSKVHATAGPELPPNNTTGTSWQVSGRYAFVLPSRGTWVQECKAGLDYKRTNNDFIVNEETISNTLVSEFQIVGEYSTEFVFPKIAIDAGAEVFISPGELSDSMSSEAYNSLRPGADHTYIFTRFGTRAVFTLPMDFLFDARARFQLSSGTLLPIEQYGLGGVDSVRGYINRAVNVDDVLLFNFELKTPEVSLIQQFAKTNKLKDGLRGVLFLDVGTGCENTTYNGEQKWYTLAGIGPGLRYGITPYLQARFDWGIALSNIPVNNSSNRVYYSVIASY